MPSPWQDIASSPQEITIPSPGTTPESEAVSRALEKLKIGSNGVLRLIPEVDEEGQIEYKLRLGANPNAQRLQRLVTQLKFRLINGGGEAIYELGVLDDGTAVGLSREEMDGSMKTLESMAAELNATIEVLREIEMPCASPSNIEHPISTLIGQVTLPTNGKEHITAPVLVQPPVSDRPPIVTRRGSKLPKDLVRTLVGEGPRICMEIKVTSNSHEEEGSSFLDFDPF